MSSILLQQLPATPEDAKTGFFRIYATPTEIRVIDENGVDIPIGGGAPGPPGPPGPPPTGNPNSFAVFDGAGNLSSSQIVNEFPNEIIENYNFDPTGPGGAARTISHNIEANGGTAPYQGQRIFTNVSGPDDWDATFSRTVDASLNKNGAGKMGRHALYGGRADVNEGPVEELRGTQIDLFLRNDAEVLSNMSGAAVRLQLEDTAKANFVTPFEAFTDLAPGSEAEIIGMFRTGGNVEGNVVNYLGLEQFANFTGTVQNYTYARANPGFNGDAASVTGYVWSPNGSAEPFQNVAFAAFMDQLSDENAQFGANVAFQADQGIFIQFVNRELDDPVPDLGLPFQSGNLFFYELECPESRSGDSVQTVSGVIITVEEDVVIEAGLLGIGLNSQLQFTGLELQGGAAELEKAGSHLSIMVLEEPESGPSGGTIKEAWSYRALGVINPDGVTGVTLEEYTAFLFDPPGMFPQTGDLLWGVKVKQPDAHNYLSRDLVIGGSSETPSNDDIALEIGDKRAVKLTPVTEAERDALDTTDGEGMVALVEGGSTPGLQMYNGSEWVRASSPSVVWFSIPSDVTLDETHSTRTGLLSGDAVITLPEWSDVSDGYVVEVITDGGTHTASVAVQGSDTVRGDRTQVNGDFSVLRSPTPGLWITLGEVSEP